METQKGRMLIGAMGLRRLLLAGACMTVAATAAPTAGQAAPNDREADSVLGEVVVTARRTEETAQTVPITIQAFDDQQLRETSITETRELQYLVPGLSVAGTSSIANANWIMRGVGQAGQQGHGTPGVAGYFADVPLPLNAQSQPIYDLGSVQVLKGPQGTLFGRNTMGGAVLIYPKAPSYDGFSGYVQGMVGRYNWREAEGAANMPILADKLALRVAGHIARRDGYMKNLSPGASDQSDMHNYGFRAQLRMDPVENLTNTLMFDYYKSDTHQSGVAIIDRVTRRPIARRPVPNLLGVIPLVGAFAGTGSRFETETGPAPEESLIKQWGVTNRTDFTVSPNLSVTNILAYRRSLYNSRGVFDGTAIQVIPGLFTPLFFAVQLANEEQLTEELQLKGSLFNENFDWLVGGFYAKNSPLKGNVGRAVIFGNILGAGATNYSFHTDESHAIFGNGTIHLSAVLEGLDFNFGYRKTWDKYKVCTATAPAGGALALEPYDYGPGQCADGALVPGVSAVSTARGDNSGTGWTMALNWKATDAIFVYGTARRGYRSGYLNSPAFGAGTPIAALQAVEPETVTDFEAGAKTRWSFGNGWRALLDVSVFSAKTKNLQNVVQQISTSTYNRIIASAPILLGPPPAGYAAWTGCPPLGAAPPAGTGTSFDRDCNTLNDPVDTIVGYNGGARTVSGFELQAALQPTPDLTLTANYSYYHWKFQAAAVPAFLIPYAGVTGNTSPGTPRGVPRTLTLGARYQLPFGDDSIGRFVASADYYWADKVVLGPAPVGSAFPNAPNRIPSYQLANFRLDWNGVMGSAFDVSAFVRNAFNKKYEVGTSASFCCGPDVIGVVQAEPRLWGLQLRTAWGE